jgi:hypothetical protein
MRVRGRTGIRHRSSRPDPPDARPATASGLMPARYAGPPAANCPAVVPQRAQAGESDQCVSPLAGYVGRSRAGQVEER